MLADTDAIATVGVKDIEVARNFYSDKLGLKLLPSQEPSVLTFHSGKSRIMVYQSQFAGTNQATAITWIVADVNELAQALKAKGVVFEHYDFPGMTLDGDVHVMGKLRAAWFKDPDGNILSVVQG